MVLKRKRSSSELCSSPAPSSGSSTSSSPPRQNAFNFSMMGGEPSSSGSGRTMKRLRNSRPTEQIVHQRTLGLLYSAQQRPAHVQEMMDDAPMETPVKEPVVSPQGSLHRFWNINSAPTPLPAQYEQNTPLATSCDDCGGHLGDGGDGMDIDGYVGSDSACGACGKHVCFSCSVSNLGEQRRCLHCAGRKVWIGGIGWADGGVVV